MQWAVADFGEKKKLATLSGWDKTTEACSRPAGTTWRAPVKGRIGEKSVKSSKRWQKKENTEADTAFAKIFTLPIGKGVPKLPADSSSAPAPPHPAPVIRSGESKAGLPVFEKLPAGTGRFCNRTPVYRHARPEGELCVRPGGSASVWPDSASGRRYFGGHLPLWVLVWERANFETNFRYVLVSAVRLTIYTCNLARPFIAPAGSAWQAWESQGELCYFVSPPIESEVREETLSDRSAPNHSHLRKCSGHIGGAPTVEDEWEL